MKYSNLVFVDCEARGTSPVNGVFTEFGAVHYESRETFHGILCVSSPDPENPAVPLPVEPPSHTAISGVAADFAKWLKDTVKGRPTFVSDNVAYDWQWIAGMFDIAGLDNPFGHSGRRISDFYAGLTDKWGNTQEWKRWRVTAHDHNPVNDSMGNVEAFERILKEFGVN